MPLGVKQPKAGFLHVDKCSHVCTRLHSSAVRKWGSSVLHGTFSAHELAYRHIEIIGPVPTTTLPVSWIPNAWLAECILMLTTISDMESSWATPHRGTSRGRFTRNSS